MKIDNRSPAEYLRLLFPLLLLVALVGTIRALVSPLGAPGWLVSLFSVTATSCLAILVAVLLIHARNFGGYASVIVSSVLLTTWSQLFVILAILLAVTTGVENIFAAPEYSMPGDDPCHLRHILGHLTFGVGLEAILGAAMGSLLYWMVKKVVPARAPGIDSTAQ